MYVDVLPIFVCVFLFLSVLTVNIPSKLCLGEGGGGGWVNAECGNTDIDSKSGNPLLLNFMEVYSRVVNDQSQQEYLFKFPQKLSRSMTL